MSQKFPKPTREMLEFFKQRTRQHIDGVVRYMRRLEGFAGLDAEELRERAQQHDRDKYTDKELILPYIWLTEYHRVNNETGSVPPELKSAYELSRDATGQHIKQNRHHPEAHADPTAMTDLDLAEMVADWSSMADELGEGSARGWANKNVGSKWKFSPEQTEQIYKMIDWLEKPTRIDRSATIRYRGHLYRAANQYRDVGFTPTGRWGNEGSGILYCTRDRILLLRRSQSVEEPGTWGLPGGAVPECNQDGCMDAFESAQNEVREELGWLPPSDCVDQYQYREPRFQYTTFMCRVDDNVTEQPLRLNWENDDWLWATQDDLQDLDLHFGVVAALQHLDPFGSA